MVVIRPSPGGEALGQQNVCWNYSPITARIWPMVCMAWIRFFFIDIIKYLQKSGLYWEGVCEWSAALLCCKNCLRDLLADTQTHLADGLHGADQILFHRHNQLPPVR